MRRPSPRSGTDARNRLGLATAAVFLVLLASALLVSVTVRVDAQQMPDPEAPREPGLAAQLERGRNVYAFSCTTCHGVTGQGFAEARAAFPGDHYDCSRCHMPLNPPAMTPSEIDLAQSVFSLGDPPALADLAVLGRYSTAAGLYAYTRATMPRWDPGRLSDDDFRDVTAYVLHLAGFDLDDELTYANAAALDLGGRAGD